MPMYEYVCSPCPGDNAELHELLRASRRRLAEGGSDFSIVPELLRSHRFDAFSSIADRDEVQKCPACGCVTGLREEIPLQGSRVDTQGGYRMKAVLKSGREVEGHFAQASRKKSGLYYKP